MLTDVLAKSFLNHSGGQLARHFWRCLSVRGFAILPQITVCCCINLHGSALRLRLSFDAFVDSSSVAKLPIYIAASFRGLLRKGPNETWTRIYPSRLGRATATTFTSR